VDRVPHAEHAAGLQMRRVHLVVAPQRGAGDFHLDIGQAQQVPNDLNGGLLVDDRRGLADVVTPDDEPFVPRPDHAHQPGADAADVRAGLDHPVQHRRTVTDVRGDVGLEGDVHRAGDVHPALHGQADVAGDLGPGAVRADEVPGPDRVLLAGEAVPDLDVDAIGILPVA
jgi:hypothetical protein